MRCSHSITMRICALFALITGLAGVIGSTPAGPVKPSDRELRAVIAAMDDETLVGQLMMFGFDGQDSADVLAKIERYHLGNTIIMLRNYDNPRQLQRLTNAAQAAALAHNGLGMLIGTDQEGGKINRLKTEPFVIFQSADWLAHNLQPRAGRLIAGATGRQLGALGINLALAPVVDVTVSPHNVLTRDGRAYGSDPAVISAWGEQFVRGFRDSGILSCPKHFPGYGAEPLDPHNFSASNPATIDVLRSRDFLPFKAMAEAGAPLIMTAHTFMPNVPETAGEPATFSPFMLETVLRGELGFDGVIITDDMNMSSAVQYPPEEMALRAFNAGVDIYLLVNKPELQETAYRSTLDALRSGALPRARLEQSALRVLRVKRDYGVLNPRLNGAEALARCIGPWRYSCIPGRQAWQPAPPAPQAAK